MKIYRPLFRLLLIGTLTGWLNVGCHNGTDDSTDPQANCRLQRIVSATKTLGSTGTDETAYDYDAAENLVKKTLTSTYTYGTVGNSNTTTTETYTYSADNFLTEYSYLTVYKDVFSGKTSMYQYSDNKLYTYANSRLAGYVQTTVSQKQTTTTTVSYAYDAAGQLIKAVSSNGPGYTSTWTYQNGKLIDYVERSSTTESRPFVMQDGLITKAHFAGTIGYSDGSTGPHILDQVYEYDAQRRVIKQQEFVNDTLSRYWTQEWQTGKPATHCLPAFKGHPVILPPFGESGVLTKKRDYSSVKKQANAINQYLETTYTNQLNAQGYVTNTKFELLYLNNGQQQPDVTTTVYTYTGCN